MAKPKNPNRNPDKGWTGEIDQVQQGNYTAPQESPKKPFTWGKPVSGGEARPNQMNVPRRLNEQSKTGRPKSNLVQESNQLMQKRKPK